MKIWMRVTADEYELPIAVASSARELADMLGVTENNIQSQWCKIKSGIIKHGTLVCVECDDDE